MSDLRQPGVRQSDLPNHRPLCAIDDGAIALHAPPSAQAQEIVGTIQQAKETYDGFEQADIGVAHTNPAGDEYRNSLASAG